MRVLLLTCLLPLLAAGARIPLSLLTEDEVAPPQTKEFNSLQICAFNIQVFGDSKMSKPEVVDVLIDILQKYDVTLIQEIRDAEETAIYDLLNQLNAEVGAGTYDMVMSERLGPTSSKEQYAFFYKPSIMSVNHIYQYPIDYSEFSRPPYVVTFDVPGYTINQFAYLGIHVDPDLAPEEIDRLVDVYDAGISTGGVPTEDWILGGDFNADCSYVGPGDWENIRLRNDPRFTWVIDDDADTNLASSSCAYDRFVLTGRVTQHYQPTAQIFDFWSAYGLTEEVALDVSDHYPIEMMLD